MPKLLVKTTFGAWEKCQRSKLYNQFFMATSWLSSQIVLRKKGPRVFSFLEGALGQVYSLKTQTAVAAVFFT
jgi:hypothetical protein